MNLGAALVEHVQRFYGPNTVIEHAICTHPDSDHACGLRNVLRDLPVLNLWLHGVWHHAAEMLPFFDDKRWTTDGLEKNIRSEYPVIAELIELANAQKTPVFEPFEGQQIGPLRVLSPDQWAYVQLGHNSEKRRLQIFERLKQEKKRIEAKEGLIRTILGGLIEKAVEWISESWDIELLKDGAVTAAENESSAVLTGSLVDIQFY